MIRGARPLLLRLSPLLFAALLATASAPLTSSVAHAQIGEHAENPWEEYRALYNARNYRDAIPWAIEAIQREPENPTYYLGLARGYFWLEDYELATFYYDLYLEQFGPTLPASTPANNRVDRVRAERDSSNTARPTPTTPVQPPEAQQQARTFLLQRIEEGTILTATGGGAWSVYQGLLRSGYARPDLLVLRRQLAEALLAEAELFAPRDRAMLPALSETQWTAQRQRVRYWQQLQGVAPRSAGEDLPLETALARLRAAAPGTPEARHARVASLLATAEGQLQYLNMNWDRARELFADAVQLDAGCLPAHMGLLNSMYHASVVTRAEREAALSALAAASANRDDAREILALYRASFHAQDRDSERAVDLLINLLGL